MQKKPQQCQVKQQTACSDEKLLAAFEEINFLPEQVEFLRELVDSQNQRLQHKNQHLQELQQELKATNQELCVALLMPEVNFPCWSNLSLEGLAHLTLFEAKELAKTILKTQKCASESVAELLTIIYGEEVKPEELQKIDRLTVQTNPSKNHLCQKNFAESNQLRTNSKQLAERSKELACGFVTFQTYYTQIHKHFTDIAVTKAVRTSRR
jgi:uncharacterized coiled-coil DUF342 family protein